MSARMVHGVVGLAFLLASAAGGAAQTGRPDDVVRLTGDLRADDPSVRLAAAKRLAVMGPAAKAALPALTEAAVTDPDEDVRRMADKAVAAIQGKAAEPAEPAEPTPEVKSLIRELGSRDAAARLKAVKGLSALGPLARPAAGDLRRLSRDDPDEDVRRLASAALKAVGDGGAAEGPVGGRSLVGTWKGFAGGAYGPGINFRVTFRADSTYESGTTVAVAGSVETRDTGTYTTTRRRVPSPRWAIRRTSGAA